MDNYHRLIKDIFARAGIGIDSYEDDVSPPNQTITVWPDTAALNSLDCADALIDQLAAETGLTFEYDAVDCLFRAVWPATPEQLALAIEEDLVANSHYDTATEEWFDIRLDPHRMIKILREDVETFRTANTIANRALILSLGDTRVRVVISDLDIENAPDAIEVFVDRTDDVLFINMHEVTE
jgi:hypothetical protein